MPTLRAFLTTVVGLTVTGFAFVVAAAFSFVLIALVAAAAIGGIAVVKLSPYLRAGLARVEWSRDFGRFARVRRWRPGQIWNDGRGVIIDA